MKYRSMWITFILFIVIAYIWMEFRFFKLLPGPIQFGKYWTAIPSINNCLFLPQCWLCIYIRVVLLNFYGYFFFKFRLFFDALSWKNKFQSYHIPLNQESWQEQYEMTVFYSGNVNFLWKKSIIFSWRTKIFSTIILPILHFSSLLPHILHVFLYLNGLNLCI